jgi:hypothetical protein
MASKRKIGKAKPTSSVTRKVTRGVNKGDTVQFRANSSSAQQPGKLKPRRVIKDVGRKNTSTIKKSKTPSMKRTGKK